jgi:twitching motility protein PilT
MLSFTLQAVFCQQLIPRTQGRGRVLAVEIMIVNAAVRALVRDNKSHQIQSIIQTGGQFGMQTMNQAIFQLYRTGQISWEDALDNSPDPSELERQVQRTSSESGSYRR